MISDFFSVSYCPNLTPSFLFSNFQESKLIFSRIQKSFLFQGSLFLGITTLLTWLKSTLLLNIKCFDIIIYMKTQCLQTTETQHYCRKENTWEVGRGRERVTLIKSLIMRDRKDALEVRLQKIELNFSADIFY